MRHPLVSLETCVALYSAALIDGSILTIENTAASASRHG